MDLIPGARPIPDPETEIKRLDAARSWQADSPETIGDFLDTVSEGNEITIDGIPRRVASVSRDEATRSITITLEPADGA